MTTTLPTLTVNYHHRTSLNLPRPTPLRLKLHIRLLMLPTTSSTGTGPDTDPSPHEFDKAHIVSSLGIGSSPVRPSLRHMPSWQSFASRRSRRSDGVSPDSDVDDDEAFGDAPDESSWEKRSIFVGVRETHKEREASVGPMRSSRGSRVGIFRRLTSVSPGPRALKLDIHPDPERMDTPLTMPTLSKLHSRPCALPTMDEGGPG